jgi:hypothetical protein
MEEWDESLPEHGHDWLAHVRESGVNFMYDIPLQEVLSIYTEKRDHLVQSPSI